MLAGRGVARSFFALLTRGSDRPCLASDTSRSCLRRSATFRIAVSSSSTLVTCAIHPVLYAWLRLST